MYEHIQWELDSKFELSLILNFKAITLQPGETLIFPGV